MIHSVFSVGSPRFQIGRIVISPPPRELSYVSTSRARYDAQIFTDNAAHLGKALARENLKDSALSAAQIEKYSAQNAIN